MYSRIKLYRRRSQAVAKITSGSGGPVIPAGAIKDSDGNYILDRDGNYIVTRP
jgi:hypothetical protein